MGRCIFLIGCFFCLCLAAPKTNLAQTAQEQLNKIRSSEMDTIGGRVFYIHTIKRGQTLYMISKAYGVEVNDVIRENPQVKEGIKSDEKIRIPVPVQPVATQPIVAQPSKTTKNKPVAAKDTLKQIPEEKVPVKEEPVVKKILLPCGMDTANNKSVYQVALMLPLFLGEVNSINVENSDRKTTGNSPSFQFLPFYEGFRMAIDSLEKSGFSVRLYVYDVDKDTLKTRQLLKKPEMKSMDLIIGLLYHHNFQIVASFAQRNKIPIINPISERSEIVKDNPFVFKVQPDKKVMPLRLAEYFARICGNGQILIIRSAQYSDKDFPDEIKKACLDRELNVRIVEGQEAAITSLSKELENFVVAFSNKPDYVTDFTRRMYQLRNDHSITLFGLPDWSLINGVETEYLVALKTHMIEPAFIDYSNPGIQEFVRRYQKNYKSDPELLAFQGFDVGNYFLSAMQKFGTDFGRCLKDYNINSLLTHFQFSNTGGSGYENQNWAIFHYQNYQLVPSNF